MYCRVCAVQAESFWIDLSTDRMPERRAVLDYKQGLLLLPGVQIGFETQPIVLGILFTG